MKDQRRDSFVIFADRSPTRPLTRGVSVNRSAWGILAVMGIGALLALNGVFGLLADDRIDSFGAFGGGARDGIYLVQIVLGAGLVMRRELARRVYLVFAIVGLVATLLSPAAYSASVVSYVLGVALDVITIALILNRNVARAFD